MMTGSKAEGAITTSSLQASLATTTSRPRRCHPQNASVRKPGPPAGARALLPGNDCHGLRSRVKQPSRVRDHIRFALSVHHCALWGVCCSGRNAATVPHIGGDIMSQPPQDPYERQPDWQPREPYQQTPGWQDPYQQKPGWQDPYQQQPGLADHRSRTSRSRAGSTRTSSSRACHHRASISSSRASRHRTRTSRSLAGHHRTRTSRSRAGRTRTSSRTAYRGASRPTRGRRRVTGRHGAGKGTWCATSSPASVASSSCPQ